jgi:hypothetical protein
LAEIKVCPKCRQEHDVMVTKDSYGNVVANFCPKAKICFNVTTEDFNGVNVREKVRNLVDLEVSVRSLPNLHDNGIKRLARKIAYEFMRTPFAERQERPFNYYFVLYHTYHTLKEYAVNGETA